MALHSEVPFTPTTLISGLLVLGGVFFTFFFQSGLSLPLLNEKKLFEFTRRNAKQRFLTSAKTIISSGFASVSIEFWHPLQICMHWDN